MEGRAAGAQDAESECNNTHTAEVGRLEEQVVRLNEEVASLKEVEGARGAEVVREVVPDDDGEVVRLTAEVEALKANPLNPQPLTQNPKP